MASRQQQEYWKEWNKRMNRFYRDTYNVSTRNSNSALNKHIFGSSISDFDNYDDVLSYNEYIYDNYEC